MVGVPVSMIWGDSVWEVCLVDQGVSCRVLTRRRCFSCIWDVHQDGCGYHQVHLSRDCEYGDPKWIPFLTRQENAKLLGQPWWFVNLTPSNLVNSTCFWAYFGEDSESATKMLECVCSTHHTQNSDLGTRSRLGDLHQLRRSTCI